MSTAAGSSRPAGPPPPGGQGVFMRGLRLGRLGGVEIVADASLLIIFALITVSLALGLFPAWHPEWSSATAWLTALAAAVLFLASVLAHELSHALVGRARGMTIRRITLFVFGGMAHLEDEPRTWRTEFWMAVVGPVTSLLIGIACYAGARVLTGPLAIDPHAPGEVLSRLGPAPTLLLWLGPVNVILALFNLVPGFPLDGGRVLRALLWGLTGSLRRATRWASGVGQGFAWLLIAAGVAMILGQRVPVFGSGPIGGIWLAFIGWFLNNAAYVSYRQLLVRESLEDVPVMRLMWRDPVTVGPGERLSDLVEDYLLAGDQRVFPVLEGETFRGLVCLEDVRRVARGQWADTPVSQVMTPAHELVAIAPGEDAAEALAMLSNRDVNQLPVVEHGRLRGLLRREDLLKWLAVYGEEPSARPR